MAEGDLTLTARLRLEVDPNQIRAELQKAGGIMGQAAGGGGMAGGLAQRTGGGGGMGVLGMAGVGAAGGAAVIGSYIVLQRILRLMENSPLLSSTLDLITGGIGAVIGAILTRGAGEKGREGGVSFGLSLWNLAGDLGNKDMSVLEAFVKWMQSPGPGPNLNMSGMGGWQPKSGLLFSAKDYLPGGAMWNGIMPSVYASSNEGFSPYDSTSFMMQWARENPGGGIGMGGPPVVGGMRSAGTYSTLLSQLLKGTSLAQTSQWGNTDIGAQGKWWGPSADSGAIMNRIQKYYQVANYGGAGGTQWGDVSKLVEKFLSDSSRLDKSPGALFNEISGRIEPLGRTWWRSSEYGNSMADVMTMGSPGITPPDIGTLFSGLTFAPEIKVTIGAQELNDIITQIIESGNFTTRTAI